jgi:beta-lactamase superfamily II metal-dependent hydrolase
MAASGPTKDTSVPNLSSIAVLAEFGGRAVLLTGDAHADVLASSIRTLQRRRGRDGERLRLDALKLSHHGSANATTVDLLDAVDCSRFLVPTDGSTFYHPDREAIARVIVHGGTGPALHFNHRTDLNEFWADAELQHRYGYETAFPEDAVGLRVVL